MPNFYIPEYGSRITSSIYVRGMGARIDQPVVGLVVDNVPVLNKDNYDFDIADIESLQMLRGPQSTMYGRNTMGGVVSIRTLSPLSFQGCRLLLEYGKANTTKASVSHYSRPSRSFGVGGNVSVYHTDGFFRNLNNGKTCDKETSGRAYAETGVEAVRPLYNGEYGDGVGKPAGRLCLRVCRHARDKLQRHVFLPPNVGNRRSYNEMAWRER